MSGDFMLAPAEGVRDDADVDFGVAFAQDRDKWAVRIVVTSNHRQDVYAYTGFASKDAARAAVNAAIHAIAADLGIETDSDFLRTPGAPNVE